jgi:amino acid transporter
MMMGFSLTTPAIIAFIAYAILALVIILPFEFPVTDERTGETQKRSKYNLTGTLCCTITSNCSYQPCYHNCMMHGNCVLWSYVAAFVSVFWVSLYNIRAYLHFCK